LDRFMISRRANLGGGRRGAVEISFVIRAPGGRVVWEVNFVARKRNGNIPSPSLSERSTETRVKDTRPQGSDRASDARTTLVRASLNYSGA
jgi:hypothetical protein